MTKNNMDLSELLAKHDQGDLLRSVAEAVLQLITETDVEGLIGAGRHERSGERTTCQKSLRSGWRDISTLRNNRYFRLVAAYQPRHGRFHEVSSRPGAHYLAWPRSSD